MNEKRIYTIAGTQWYQAPLTYGEWGKALDLASGFSDSLIAGKSFNEIARDAYERGLVPQLFRVILKPHYPNPRSVFSHYYYRLINKVDRDDLAKPLTLEEIFAILGDFFFINTSWIESLMSSDDGSDVRKRALLMIQVLMGGVFPSMILPSSSPGETSTPSTPQGDS